MSGGCRLAAPHPTPYGMVCGRGLARGRPRRPSRGGPEEGERESVSKGVKLQGKPQGQSSEQNLGDYSWEHRLVNEAANCVTFVLHLCA